MPVQPTMGTIVAGKPAPAAAGHTAPSAGTTPFLDSLKPLLTGRPSSPPQQHPAQPVANPVVQGKILQNGAETAQSEDQASEQASPTPTNQNSKATPPIPATQPHAIALLGNTSAEQSSALAVDSLTDTNGLTPGPRSLQRLGATSHLAARKPDPASKQSDASVCVPSTLFQTLPDALPCSAKAPEPQVEEQPAQMSGDQPEPVRGHARGNEVVTSTASSPADALGETTANSNAKPGEPDIPLPANPPPASANKTAEPALMSPTSLVIPEPTAGSTTAAPAAPAQTHASSSGAALSPAAQIAPAIVSLATTSSGTQQLTVRLDPEELGRVEIRIEQPKDGAAQVTIIADRPETLNLLLRDQPQLQHALDQAGIPAEGRAVTFHVASADPSAGSNQYAPSPDTGGSGMQADSGSSHREQRSARPSKNAENEPLAPIPSAASFSVRQVRLGLDITA